jgi:hypothetical protein
LSTITPGSGPVWNKGLQNTEKKKVQERGVVLWENRGMEKYRKHIDKGVWNVGIITQDS